MQQLTIDRPFVLIRHGQTDANRDLRIAGTLDAQLTEAGLSAARALSGLSWPAETTIFASPQTRAHQTAQLAFPGRSITLEPDLRERDWGELEGGPVARQTPRDQTPPGGESWEALLTRVARGITTCLLAAPEGHLPVLVAHSGVIRATRALAGLDPAAGSPANTTPYLFTPLGGGRFSERPLFPAE